MEKKNNKTARNKVAHHKITVSETIILAALPIIAYAVVFSFEWGYFSVFKIPLEFASFDLSRVFLALYSIIVIFFLVYLFTDSILSLISNQPESIRQRLSVLLIFIVGVLIYFLIYSNVPEILRYLWIFAVVLVLPNIIIFFLLPLITQKSRKGYLAKLQADDEVIIDTTRRNASSSVLDVISRIMDIRMIFALLLTGVIIFLAYDIGVSSALQQSEFRVVNTSPERVVLWITNDQVICAPFDRVTKQINPSFIVLKLGEDSEIEYRLEKIGPLKVRTLSHYSPITTITPSSPTVINPSVTSTSDRVITATPSKMP